jgi:hypothetical protein
MEARIARVRVTGSAGCRQTPGAFKAVVEKMANLSGFIAIWTTG